MLCGPCTSISMHVSDADATIANWEAPEGALDYDVIRGDLANITVDDEVTDLGEVLCVEQNSADTTTAGGNEDTATPAPGQVFFFLVQSYDGQVESGWGKDSTDRERVVRLGNGGCL